jgi:hypothetical protein
LPKFVKVSLLKHQKFRLSHSHINPNNGASTTDNIIDLASHCGIVATVVGDPKQSKPIGLSYYDRSAIEWVIKKERFS